MRLADHLDRNIFTDNVEQVPNRNGYGEGLKEAGEKDVRVVALSADLTGSTKTNLFADAFPERFVQVGIAEQNMASVASGMAAVGKIPFIASYAMFSPGRSWEQVRTTIAYNNSNVKVIGAHSGVSVGPDGATHQAVEDMAIMRVIPNMVVIAPCDVHEARKATLWAAEYEGPVYIRIARENSPVVTTADSPFDYGKAQLLAEGVDSAENKVGIITTGILAHNALMAAKELNEAGISTSVLHVPFIKPLDEEAVLALAKNNDFIVTLEEHQVAGGLGSAVAEYLSETHPTKIIRLGVHDQFGQSGTPEELLAHYGMDTKTLLDTVRKNLN
ncbi:transketolase family protein [Candidatus Kaiserbacteria bacterium]|nr:transketolase family protein [Candidatus Kaiserbacteria bacterium]MCB9811720.1 transketolase family protein [Candidatus Nomurabacteria bacterium]